MAEGFILSWDTPLEVLLDKLRDLNRIEDINFILDTNHKWEDDYHYHIQCCEFCGIYDSDSLSKLPCPKAIRKKQSIILEKERNEYYEYKKLKEEKARFEYLRGKFEHLT